MSRRYWLMSFVALVLILACGCQITTKDGGVFGFRAGMNGVYAEFYSEAKETSGEGLIRTDIDKGWEQWITGADTDGDGEPDTSVEPEDVE